MPDGCFGGPDGCAFPVAEWLMVGAIGLGLTNTFRAVTSLFANGYPFVGMSTITTGL
jgi:hypothetical protein